MVLSIYTSLTWHNAGVGDTGHSLEDKVIMVIASDSQEESFFEWNKFSDIPNAIRASIREVADGQRLHYITSDAQEFQAISTSRRGETSGVQQDKGGDSCVYVCVYVWRSIEVKKVNQNMFKSTQPLCWPHKFDSMCGPDRNTSFFVLRF